METLGQEETRRSQVGQEETRRSQVEQEETRRSQVEQEMGLIETSLSCLAETINKLSGRLPSICREDYPAPEVESEKKEQALVPLAFRLKAYKEMIEIENYRIQSILERLEL